MKWLDQLNIPLCQPRKIPIKTLVEQLDSTYSNRRLLEKSISSMRLVSILDEKTSRIRSFKDDEHSFQSIYILYIELKTEDRITEVSTLIHSAFQEPTVLIFKHIGSYYLSTATKRISKADVDKSVIEETAVAKVAPTLDTKNLDLSELSGENLKQYYDKINTLIYKLKVFQETNVFPRVNFDFKCLMNEVDLLNHGIKKLNEEYKRASMLSEKMKIDEEIYTKEELLRQLLNQLKGE